MENQYLIKLEKDDVFCQFLKDNFDVKQYASQSLQDSVVSELLSKLTAGINMLDRELHQQVSTHYEDLLSQATGIETLENVLGIIYVRVQTLLSAVERLRIKLLEPYNKASHHTLMLSHLQNTCDLLRAIVRITYLTKRLQGQMLGGDREITKLAQNLNELDHIMTTVDLTDLHVIENEQQLIRQARKETEYQAEQMLIRGLETQNPTHVAIALQVFYNLNLLIPTIEKCVRNNIESLQKNVHEALSMNMLCQLQSVEHGHRNKGVPGKASLPSVGSTAEFRATLWNNMEKLTDQIYASCIHILHLQRVLVKKKDPVSHVCFMEELEKNGKETVLTEFWEEMKRILSKEFNSAANDSTYIKQAFEAQFPKLLNLFRDLWQRLQNFISPITITIEDDSTEMLQKQKFKTFNPEIILRSTIREFEQVYLTQSLSRLFDPINIMFASNDTTLPPIKDVDIIVKTISSELNAAAVDPELHKLVAKNIAKTIKLFAVKCEQMLCTDSEATQIINQPTAGQTLNAHLVNLLDHFKQQLTAMNHNASGNTVSEVHNIINESLQVVTNLMKAAVQPLLSSIIDSVEAIILTIHNEDYSISNSDGSSSAVDGSSAVCSLYMKELKAFLTRVQLQYLAQFDCEEFLTTSLIPLANRTVELLARHITLVRPLGNGGKQKLAADLAELEKIITVFCPSVSDLGSSFRLIRSIRPLLFQLPNHVCQSPAVGDIIPYSTAIHILFSKVPEKEELLSLHETAGWSVSQYSRWLDDHPNEHDRLKFLQGSLEIYAQSVRQKQEKEYTSVYPLMLQLLKKGLEKIQ